MCERCSIFGHAQFGHQDREPAPKKPKPVQAPAKPAYRYIKPVQQRWFTDLGLGPQFKDKTP